MREFIGIFALALAASPGAGCDDVQEVSARESERGWMERDARSPAPLIIALGCGKAIPYGRGQCGGMQLL
jgi:hypothetical protein